MACMMLVCFLLLSRQAAEVSGNMKDRETLDRVIAVDPGHGGEKLRKVIFWEETLCSFPYIKRIMTEIWVKCKKICCM